MGGSSDLCRNILEDTKIVLVFSLDFSQPEQEVFIPASSFYAKLS